MSKIALLKCMEYNLENIKEKIREGFGLIGFDPKQFQDKKVVLKPNLLTSAAPDTAVITHPVFFHAALQIVKENNGIPILAENPATKPLSKVAAAAGYTYIVQAEGAEMAHVRQTEAVLVDKALKFRRFEISKAFCDADIIINLPKLKTHSLTYLSGAVKNFLGTIPGMAKSQWHLRAPNSEEFSELLLDLNECLYSGFEKPKRFLHIMDGILGMEGEGPGPSGKPRFVGALLVGEDPIAMDLTAARLIGMDPTGVHTITGGFKRSFGISAPEEATVVGETPESLAPAGYKTPLKKNLWDRLLAGPFMARRFKNALVEKPVPQEGPCTLCYQCKAICPAGAIDLQKTKKQVPAYDYEKCIRCFCCMEICPEAAIKLKRGGLQWLMGL